MLWVLFVLLLILWLAGMVASVTLHGFLHILLVGAVLTMIFQLRPGRSGAA